MATLRRQASRRNVCINARKTKEILQQVRDLGRSAKENERRSLAERQLAGKLRKALKPKQFSPEQEAELQVLRHVSPKQVSARRAKDLAFRAEELMQQVRELGHYPKESRFDGVELPLARMPRLLAPPLCDPVWRDGQMLYVDDVFEPRVLSECVS